MDDRTQSTGVTNETKHSLGPSQYNVTRELQFQHVVTVASNYKSSVLWSGNSELICCTVNHQVEITRDGVFVFFCRTQKPDHAGPAGTLSTLKWRVRCSRPLVPRGAMSLKKSSAFKGLNLTGCCSSTSSWGMAMLVSLWGLKKTAIDSLPDLSLVTTRCSELRSLSLLHSCPHQASKSAEWISPDVSYTLTGRRLVGFTSPLAEMSSCR